VQSVGRRDNTETFRNFGLLQIRFPGVCQQLHIVSWLCTVGCSLPTVLPLGKISGNSTAFVSYGNEKQREKVCIYVSPWRSHNLTSEISNMHTARENAVLSRILSWEFKLRACKNRLKNKISATFTKNISLSRIYIYIYIN
jgi:hypothetical protein